MARTEHAWMRWPILFLMCFSVVGIYASYDIPSALKSEIQKKYHMSDSQFNMLYTVYSISNVVLPFFAGIFTDRVGILISLTLFLSFVCVGQIIVYMSDFNSSIPLYYFGRFVFGLGGETVNVGALAVLSHWFGGKEMAFAQGISLAIARGASVANFHLSPRLFAVGGISLVNFVGAAVTVVSLVCGVLMGVLDRVYSSEDEAATAAEKAGLINSDSEVKTVSVVTQSPALTGSPVVRRRSVSSVRTQTDTPVTSDAEEPVFDTAVISEFSYASWLLMVAILTFYCAVLPFNNVAPNFLETRDGLSLQLADSYVSVPFIISAFISPLFGFIVDKVGRRSAIMLASTAMVTLTHILYTFSSMGPLVPVLLFGFGYTMFASTSWPSLPLLVNERYIGTAYGLVLSVQNLGLAGVPLLVGFLKDTFGSYYEVELLNIAFGLVTIVLLVLLANEAGDVLRKVEGKEDSKSQQTNDGSDV